MRIKAYIGYFLAIMALPIALGTFIGMNYLSHKMVDVTGIKVSPWFTGGEVVKTVEHPNYRMLIHRPVFDGLFSDRAEGFVQIDLEPTKPSDFLPEKITEKIDYNNDGNLDFSLEYDTPNNLVKITSSNPSVLSLQGSYILKERRAVRINLRSGN